jgi:uncharacterized protein (DUF849 family)
MNPTILSCAVTGSHTTREHNATLPVTPQEIADDCIVAARLGAAICHIHVRDPDTGKPSMKFEYYEEVVERIRASDTDMIINLTTGPGGRFVPSADDPAVAAPESLVKTPEQRTEHVVRLKPEICTLDLNTMWFGGGAVINSPDNIKKMAERIYAAGVKPELEVFDSGDIQLAHALIKDGTIRQPTLFQIVTGVQYGFAPGSETMLYAKSLLPADTPWAAFGASRHAFPMLAQAFLLGGHCRIGMEDAVYLDRGVKCNGNGELVQKAVDIITTLGGQLATVEQARQILELPAK